MNTFLYKQDISCGVPSFIIIEPKEGLYGYIEL